MCIIAFTKVCLFKVFFSAHFFFPLTTGLFLPGFSGPSCLFPYLLCPPLILATSANRRIVISFMYVLRYHCGLYFPFFSLWSHDPLVFLLLALALPGPARPRVSVFPYYAFFFFFVRAICLYLTSWVLVVHFFLSFLFFWVTWLPPLSLVLRTYTSTCFRAYIIRFSLVLLSIKNVPVFVFSFLFMSCSFCDFFFFSLFSFSSW